MADGWLPGWARVTNPRSSGGTYGTDYHPYPWRVVFHSTQSSGMPNVATHPATPHLWYDPRTRQKIQCVPFDRSSFAMYQGNDHPHYTNKACAIQIELVGWAEEAGDWPEEYLRNIAVDVLAPICRWVASVDGRIDLGNVPDPGVIPGSSYENAPQRLSWGAWADFNGVCAHRHVPGNGDRWDAGLLDLRRIARYAAEILGGGYQPASEEDDLTPDESRKLNELHGLLQGLTPTIQQGFNLAHATDGLLKNMNPVLQQTYNQTAWTWERIQQLDAGDGDGPAEKVLDVEASLAKATPAQLMDALKSKLG